MVAETKKTDILASLGLVKAPASLTCLGKVRVGEEGPRCQEVPVGFALETNAVAIFVVCSSTSRLLSLPGTKPVLGNVKNSFTAVVSIAFFVSSPIADFMNS